MNNHDFTVSSVPHDSSRSHVTGRSEFVDDRPLLNRELFVGVVGAPCAAGKIKRIHFGDALKIEGVVGLYTAQDLAHNVWGTIKVEQPILVDQEIGYLGEPVCVIAAKTEKALELAKKCVQIAVDESEPILSLKDAIERKSFLYSSNPFRRGDLTKGFSESDHILEGWIEMGGQEHFYLESQATAVYPLENGHYEIHSSSQHPTETQHLVAEAIGVPQHHVTCIVKRMGGGFGGKESQAAPLAALAALVSQKTQRPARIILSKDDDMKITGKRHPFRNWYKIGFKNDGKICALESVLYANGGAYTDLSPSILDRAVFHIDGAYFIPNISVQGHVCRTNLQSNTAFRGFGGPQGILTIESIIEKMAQVTSMDAAQIRQANFYSEKNGLTTHYGQTVQAQIFPKLYAQLSQSSDYVRRRVEVERFNSKNLYKKRGLSLTASKFGIAFTAKFLNQANALVVLHRDGTFQVGTGATEMGQGVNTKIQQSVAQVFDVDISRVRVMPTSTEKNANTSPTAASSGADMNCAAAAMAAEEIRERLAKVAHAMFSGQTFDGVNEINLDELSVPQSVVFKNNRVVHTDSTRYLSLEEVIQFAYLNRVSLTAYAHYKTPGIGFNKATSQGTPFKYFTNGLAVSEVEIDLDTGAMKILRSDLLMDLGRPLNPLIDKGQVSGAFVQGFGWLTSEKLFYSDKGDLISHSPTTYKIPNIQDIPREYRIDFVEGEYNQEAFKGSKAVGEPPFVLGISVFTAIENALSYVRKEKQTIVDLRAPATPEIILFEAHRLAQGLSEEV